MIVLALLRKMFCAGINHSIPWRFCRNPLAPFEINCHGKKASRETSLWWGFSTCPWTYHCMNFLLQFISCSSCQYIKLMFNWARISHSPNLSVSVEKLTNTAFFTNFHERPSLEINITCLVSHNVFNIPALPLHY